MARPRYQINSEDWVDCLDWLEHQLAQPVWLTRTDHPIHQFGVVTLKECLNQWRDVRTPSRDLCESVQAILEASFTIEDWGRLRKALSARKRRRREKRIDEKPVNITLTQAAHQLLVEYRDLSMSGTLSEAVENALKLSLAELRVKHEKKVIEHLSRELSAFKASELIKIVKKYIDSTQAKRSLANSCKIAYQLFMKRPDRNALRLVQDRFIEDLVWNEMHLGVSYQSLDLFA